MKIYKSVDELFSVVRSKFEDSEKSSYTTMCDIVGASAYFEREDQQRFHAEVAPYIQAKLGQCFDDFERVYALYASPHKTTVATRPFGRTLEFPANSTAEYRLVEQECKHDDFATYTGIKLKEVRPTHPRKFLKALNSSTVQNMRYLEISFNNHAWRDDLKEPEKRFERYAKVLEELLSCWRETVEVLKIHWFSTRWNEQGMSVLNQVIHEQIAKMPSLQRLELDLENCSQFNEQERDDLIDPLFTRDDYIFTQLAFYNAPEWVHQRILKCFEQDAPGAARITGLLVNHLNNQSFSDFANSSAISNLSEKYLSKDFQIRSWQTQGWEQDIAIEESAAGDSDATTHLKELDAYGYKGFDLKQMRALLGDESSTIQLPLLTRVYLDSLDEQSMAYFFERAPHVLPHLRMLHIKWCDLPVLEKAPVWPSLEQFTIQVLSSTKSATSQLLSENAFPSLTALSLEGDSQTFAAFLQLYLSWSTLEKVRINTYGVALVDAFDASLKAGVFDAFQEANLCWSAGERYHDPSEAPAIVSRLQDASIPLVARRQLMDGYVSSHIERPLLYKFLKEMGADVTTKTKLGELQKIYDATIPEALIRSVEFSDLDRWFYR